MFCVKGRMSAETYNQKLFRIAGELGIGSPDQNPQDPLFVRVSALETRVLAQRGQITEGDQEQIDQIDFELQKRPSRMKPSRN